MIIFRLSFVRVKSRVVVDKYAKNILRSDLQVDLLFTPPHEVPHFIFLTKAVQIEQLSDLYPSTALEPPFFAV